MSHPKLFQGVWLKPVHKAHMNVNVISDLLVTDFANVLMIMNACTVQILALIMRTASIL